MRILLSISILIFLNGCSHSSGATSSSAPPITPKGKLEQIKPCPAGVPMEQCQSFLVELTGVNGAAPNTNDAKFVEQKVGSLVGDLKVQNYILIEKYAVGGFKACFDPTADGGYDAAAYAFSTFRVGDQSRWNITPVKSCQ